MAGRPCHPLSAPAWDDLRTCSVIRDNWKEFKNRMNPSWEPWRWDGRWQRQKGTRDPLVGEGLDPGSLLEPQSPASGLGLAGLWATLHGWRGCSMKCQPPKTLPLTVGQHAPGSPAHGWSKSQADGQFWQWSVHTVLCCPSIPEGHLTHFPAFRLNEASKGNEHQLPNKEAGFSFDADSFMGLCA